MTRRNPAWFIPVVLLALLAASSLTAAVSLPSLISDHMVLQSGIPVRIWGTASPGESVTVVFRDQTVKTAAGSNGEWEAYLKPLRPGGPDEMRIRGENEIVIADVLVGEVWVASGQSNMQWPVSRVRNAEQEIAAAKYPRLRLFQVKRKTAEAPLADVEGAWGPCSPESVGSFSAVGYFFGRYLHRELGVPVAVIHSSWGGTPAEAWTSIEALKADPALQEYLRRWDEVIANYPSERLRYRRRLEEWKRQAEKAKAEGKQPPRRPRAPRGPGHQHAPASLYNAMIAPLTPFNIRGAIWYQGEANSGNEEAFLYRRLFRTMIEDWRARWAQGDFPFGFVQLANFEAGEARDWPVLRESQAEALHLRNTGMAVTIDIGNPTDIHPRNKQDVGKRLALWALATVYGKSGIEYSGPVFRQLTREGSSLRVWFDHTAGGLKAAGGELKGFVIAGEDRIFHPAEARIDGETVVVSSPEVSEPAAVRYAWYNDPENTLRNSAGLPAAPFRTDRWTNGVMPKQP